MASTILTAGAPGRMAVFDNRAVDAVVGLGYASPGGYYSRYMTIVGDLRGQLSVGSGSVWTARDVDEALFMLGAHSRPSGSEQHLD